MSILRSSMLKDIDTAFAHSDQLIALAAQLQANLPALIQSEGNLVEHAQAPENQDHPIMAAIQEALKGIKIINAILAAVFPAQPAQPAQ